MQTELTLGEALKAGWDNAFSKFGLILGSLVLVQVILFGIGIIRGLASSALTPSQQLAQSSAITITLLVIIFLASYVLQFWVQILTGIGLIRIQLNVIDSKKAEFGQLFNSEGLFWRYFGGSILYGLIVLAGILLLIVPGIYWGIKYQFFGQLIVDKKVTIGEALNQSAEITYGHKWWLLGFSIIMGLINIATIFTLFLGLFITIPVTVMAHMYVYRRLSKMPPVQKS